MPYVRCPLCGLTAFNTAYWASTETCAGCGADLPRPPRRTRPQSGTDLALERAVRNRLYPRGGRDRQQPRGR
jgi:ribosomal protein L37E